MFVNSVTEFDLDNYNKELWFIDYSKILDIDTLPGEIWKDIGTIKGINFEGLYKVSNLGRIKSLSRLITNINNKNKEINRLKKENILKQSNKNTEYYQVGLSKNGKQHTKKVHKLVATAFCKNNDPKNNNCVNHIDENKLNNCAYNLEWCTQQYNINYGTARQRQKETLKEKYKNGEINYPNKKPIIQLSLLGNFIARYDSITDASKSGFNRESINRCCLCEAKKHKGYIWMYESEYTEENIKQRIEYSLSYANRKAVVQLTLDNKYIKTWPSTMSLKDIGYNQSVISSCCIHKLKTAYGYKWIYLSEYKNMF